MAPLTASCASSGVGAPVRTQRHAGARSAPVPRRHVACAAAATDAKEKPDWAGDDLLSKVVNAAINTPFLFSAMKVLAKRELISSAEKNGVDWSGHVEALKATPELEALKKEIENPDIKYPAYYTQQFHAYDEGNLNWLAAYEVEPATESMHWRTWKDPELTPEAAGQRLRGGVTDAINNFLSDVGARAPADILDVGCSVGVSTRWLEQQYPDAAVTGLDLSPHFLAVAAYRESQGAPRATRTRFIHGLAEDTGLPDNSYDLITLQFVFHECPTAATNDILKECLRLVRPGGVVVFVDNNPRSETIQKLPPALFTLMKSTEPWSDEYYTMDHEAAALNVGFSQVKTVASDLRHRTVMMLK